MLDAALADVGQLRDRDLCVIHHERDGLPVEVAGRDDVVRVGEDQRVVGDGVALARDHLRGVRERVATRTVHLRHAAQAVCVLQLCAIGMRTVDRAVGREAAQVARDRGGAGMRAHGGDTRIERHRRALERLE